jgi:hypothetical protein
MSHAAEKVFAFSATAVGVGSGGSVRPKRVRIRKTDRLRAYEEAADHLSYVAAASAGELDDGEREAMRRLADRLRSERLDLQVGRASHGPNATMSNGSAAKNPQP